jgi:uncharacterized protein
MRRSTLREKTAMLATLGLLASALGALQLSGAEPGLLYLAPALLLLSALVFDRYPGERLLAAIAPVRSLALRREGHARAGPLPPRSFPRGGVLLAMALAGRGPPPQARHLLTDGTHDRSNRQRKEAMKLKSILALVVVAVLALPAAAAAHVTLQPNEAAAGSFTVLDVRVPNETEDANTTRVDVLFPPGFAEASYQPVPGWSVKVIKEKLAKPVQTDDGPVTEGVHEIIWSGGKIAPGEFMDFPLSVQIPGKAGDALTFKALQTYDNGEVVRWIGPPNSEEPAPQVLVTAEEEEGGHASISEGSEESSSDDSDSASKGLGIAALILGALGLLAGGTALVRSRRTA